MKRRKLSHFSRKLGIVSWLKKNVQRLQLFAKQNPRFIALLFLTIALILIITLGTLIPSFQTFEGSLDLNSLSFTSQTTQPFIENTDPIKEIYINYPQNALTLDLTGKFSDIDPKLANTDKITLKPLSNPDQEPYLLIQGKNNASLRIKELKITPETQIENLEYYNKNQRLSIEKIIPNKKQPFSLSLNTSSDNLFTINFQGYEIDNFPEIHSFTWQPNSDIELNNIDKEIKFKLKFQKAPENSPFWGKLAVKKVNFMAPLTVNQDDFADYYQESAIEGGTVRLADKNYNLSTGQFLTFKPDKPEDSIRYLLGLRLVTENTATLKTNDNQTVSINEAFQGLKVDISGRTTQIEIGLNKNLPVAKLQASWLEAWLPRDVFIAFIAFLSSFVATLIGWLWELSNSEENSEEEE